MSSVSDNSNSPVYTTQLHFVSSQTADTRRPHHRLRGYHTDSTESTEKLGSGEMTRDMTLVAGSSLELSTTLSYDGSMISSPTCAEDLKTPVLIASQISPHQESSRFT